MTKTIEEAAREYANENMWYPGETSYESDIIAMEDSFADAFKAGATHVLSLPLSQRLTDEERERIKDIGLQFYDKWLNHQDECNEAVYCAVKSMLESIFGKELFGEGEG